MKYLFATFANDQNFRSSQLRTNSGRRPSQWDWIANQVMFAASCCLLLFNAPMRSQGGTVTRQCNVRERFVIFDSPDIARGNGIGAQPSGCS
ncbi:MAG: hypothetical protein WCQ21_12340, partial [Verrucomicrobiota bacterium]